MDEERQTGCLRETKEFISGCESFRKIGDTAVIATGIRLIIGFQFQDKHCLIYFIS